jgi:hypothetical protein
MRDDDPGAVPDDLIPLQEAARRLGLHRSELGRRVTRLGIPVVVRWPAKLVPWRAVAAAMALPDGFVSVVELSRSSALTADALLARAAVRGIPTRRFAHHGIKAYVRAEDAAALLAPPTPYRWQPGDPDHPCRDCGETKPVGEFYRKQSGAPQSYCKDCHKKRNLANHARRHGCPRSEA